MSEPVGPPRVVFDCVTVLQGAARPTGPAAACLKLVELGRVRLCLSPEVTAEIRDVLLRPKLRAKFPILTPDWVESVLSALEAEADLFYDVPRVIELPRDPKDEPYLNLALAAEARYLVTRDRDLLDLADNSAFQSRCTQLLILDPLSFLSHME